jgi:CHAT domain-containing protein
VEDTLKSREMALGPTHPAVATSLNGLAELYRNQGRAAEAEPLHRRGLAIREQALGPTHPRVALSLGNLATLLAQQHQRALALKLFERALQISLAVGQANADLDEEGYRGVLRQHTRNLRNYVALLAMMTDEPDHDSSPPATVLAAFVVTEAVATALGADLGQPLYLGERATKPMVQALNAAGRLGQAQVLAFATHALLAGELTGLRQPALVLTPPATASDRDDGLLALEDILGLKLPHTSWVILSACNTAADDGSGEGLSGLARAFFYAGAASLLVSQWSVDDVATRVLMTEVFRRQAHPPVLTRAEALRPRDTGADDARAG